MSKLILQSYLGEEGVFCEKKTYEYGKDKEFKSFNKASQKAIKDLSVQANEHLNICLKSVRDIKTLNIRIWDDFSMCVLKSITIKN